MARVEPAALRRLRARVDARELDQPHAVLCTDPQTGHRVVIGPFDDAHAAGAAIGWLCRGPAGAVEPPGLLFDLARYFTPEDDGLARDGSAS